MFAQIPPSVLCKVHNFHTLYTGNSPFIKLFVSARRRKRGTVYLLNESCGVARGIVYIPRDVRERKLRSANHNIKQGEHVITVSLKPRGKSRRQIISETESQLINERSPLALEIAKVKNIITRYPAGKILNMLAEGTVHWNGQKTRILYHAVKRAVNALGTLPLCKRKRKHRKGISRILLVTNAMTRIWRNNQNVSCGKLHQTCIGRTPTSLAAA